MVGQNPTAEVTEQPMVEVMATAMETAAALYSQPEVTVAAAAALQEESQTHPSTLCRRSRARTHPQAHQSRCQSPHDTPRSYQDQS